VEYEEKEVRDLLALERPKKKKDTSKMWCFNCKELGHYAKECPEENNKANRQGSVNKDLRPITCYKCKQRDTMQINAQRMVLQDFSELG
jgi:hypothetical protein